MNYVNYSQMNATQRLMFNATGYADKEYVMSKSEWSDAKAEAIAAVENI